MSSEGFLELGDTQGYAIMIHLFDNRNGKLLHSRLISFTNKVSNRLKGLIDEQEDIPDDEIDSSILAVQMKYSTQQINEFAVAGGVCWV